MAGDVGVVEVEDNALASGAQIVQQLALLEARSATGRLDAACQAAERLLSLLAVAGDAIPAGRLEINTYVSQTNRC